MNEERRKILEMLAEGKINVEEAEKLLAAVSAPESGAKESSSEKPGFKYLRILVEPGPGSEKQEKVNIRVPAKLIRAGLKWAAFIPKHAQGQVSQALREKGINMDFSKITAKDLEDILTELNDLTVEVEGKETVRIFCE
ncbi:MAG: hypothetical protein WCC06_05085 [Candidatus Aminicenantales bacterium]